LNVCAHAVRVAVLKLAGGVSRSIGKGAEQVSVADVRRPDDGR
jgi:hypothetical protein